MIIPHCTQSGMSEQRVISSPAELSHEQPLSVTLCKYCISTVCLLSANAVYLLLSPACLCDGCQSPLPRDQTF